MLETMSAQEYITYIISSSNILFCVIRNGICYCAKPPLLTLDNVPVFVPTHIQGCIQPHQHNVISMKLDDVITQVHKYIGSRYWTFCILYMYRDICVGARGIKGKKHLKAVYLWAATVRCNSGTVTITNNGWWWWWCRSCFIGQVTCWFPATHSQRYDTIRTRAIQRRVRRMQNL